MIELRNVTFTYPVGVKALRGVNLIINHNERIGVIGQNGSGKTTMMKMLNGLLRPTTGELLINNESTINKSIAELSRIVGYVFQNPDDQIFSSTIMKEVMFGPINLKLNNIKELVKDSLKQVNLWDRRNDNPYTLSYNSRKLVAIASVLAMNTPFLILDEPTTGQDPIGKRIVKKIISNNKKTFIVVSHDIEFIAETCDRVIVMNNGLIVRDGDVHDVLSDKKLLDSLGLIQPMMTRLSRRIKELPNNLVRINEVVNKLLPNKS